MGNLHPALLITVIRSVSSFASRLRSALPPSAYFSSFTNQLRCSFAAFAHLSCIVLAAIASQRLPQQTSTHQNSSEQIAKIVQNHTQPFISPLLHIHLPLCDKHRLHFRNQSCGLQPNPHKAMICMKKGRVNNMGRVEMENQNGTPKRKKKL